MSNHKTTFNRHVKVTHHDKIPEQHYNLYVRLRNLERDLINGLVSPEIRFQAALLDIWPSELDGAVEHVRKCIRNFDEKYPDLNLKYHWIEVMQLGQHIMGNTLSLYIYCLLGSDPYLVRKLSLIYIPTKETMDVNEFIRQYKIVYQHPHFQLELDTKKAINTGTETGNIALLDLVRRRNFATGKTYWTENEIFYMSLMARASGKGNVVNYLMGHYDHDYADYTEQQLVEVHESQVKYRASISTCGHVASCIRSGQRGILVNIFSLMSEQTMHLLLEERWEPGEMLIATMVIVGYYGHDIPPHIYSSLLSKFLSRENIINKTKFFGSLKRLIRYARPDLDIDFYVAPSIHSSLARHLIPRKTLEYLLGKWPQLATLYLEHPSVLSLYSRLTCIGIERLLEYPMDTVVSRIVQLERSELVDNLLCDIGRLDYTMAALIHYIGAARWIFAKRLLVRLQDQYPEIRHILTARLGHVIETRVLRDMRRHVNLINKINEFNLEMFDPETKRRWFAMSLESEHRRTIRFFATLAARQNLEALVDADQTLDHELRSWIQRRLLRMR